MFLHEITGELSKKLGIRYYSVNHRKYTHRIREHSWKHFIETRNKGGCFGPIRAGIAEPSYPDSLEQYSLLLHLRDPRDVLTSLYFSYVYSHPKRAGVFNPSDDDRKHWRNMGVDAFVLARCPSYKQRYENLCSNLLGRENVVFLKYEDMVSDYRKWLKGFFSAFRHLEPLSTNLNLLKRRKTLPEIQQEIYMKHHGDFDISSEDVYAHKRQITPGDHKRKLKPETIDILTDEFSEVLGPLSYLP